LPDGRRLWNGGRVSADDSQKQATPRVLFSAGCRICDQLLTRASRVPICEQRRTRSNGREVTGFRTGRWEWFAGLLAEETKRRNSTLGCGRRGAGSFAIGSGRAARTKPRSRASRWPVAAAEQALSFAERGSPFVALLPHVQAAKLTISASYW
jgi:hypothetical protein